MSSIGSSTTEPRGSRGRKTVRGRGSARGGRNARVSRGREAQEVEGMLQQEGVQEVLEEDEYQLCQHLGWRVSMILGLELNQVLSVIIINVLLDQLVLLIRTQQFLMYLVNSLQMKFGNS